MNHHRWWINIRIVDAKMIYLVIHLQFLATRITQLPASIDLGWHSIANVDINNINNVDNSRLNHYIEYTGGIAYLIREHHVWSAAIFYWSIDRTSCAQQRPWQNLAKVAMSSSGHDWAPQTYSDRCELMWLILDLFWCRLNHFVFMWGRSTMSAAAAVIRLQSRVW